MKRPPAEVFAFWGDHANNPQWQMGQRRCTWTSEPPIWVGSTYEQEAALMGRPIISTFECVEFEPDRRIRMKTTTSTIPLDITREVAPDGDGGTTLTATIRAARRDRAALRPDHEVDGRPHVGKDYQRLKDAPR